MKPGDKKEEEEEGDRDEEASVDVVLRGRTVIFKKTRILESSQANLTLLPTFIMMAYHHLSLTSLQRYSLIFWLYHS